MWATVPPCGACGSKFRRRLPAASGIRADDYPLLQKEGLLKFAAYARVREVTDENQILAGEDVFRIACTRCHTTHGMNGVVAKFNKLYGADAAWDPKAMAAYIQGMHNARPFMPPFPGNEKELGALVAYIADIRATGRTLPGAQSEGAGLQLLGADGKPFAGDVSFSASTPAPPDALP